MNTVPKPVRTTILYGLICAILFVPFITVFGGIIHRPLAFRVAMVLFASGYAVLLTRWGKVRILGIMFPLLILAGLACSGISTKIFLLFVPGILGWIRSGICFPSPPVRALGAELLVGLGGGLLVNLFSPIGPAAWALGVWMFFLAQAIYFPLFCRFEGSGGETEQDVFETARKQAETILSN